MRIQGSIKILLVAAAAVCCICPANAQEVIMEASGTVESFHGGFGSSFLGQSVTLDFSYDFGLLTATTTATDYIVSAPITSASIVSGIYGSGINLESNGPGGGSITDTFSLIDGSVTLNAWTSIDPPTPTFTGDVFGFSLFQNAAGNTLDLFRNVYNEGSINLRDSGSVSLSHISVAEGVAQVQAPEIDASSAASALTLLLGGLAVVRGRHKPKMQAA